MKSFKPVWGQQFAICLIKSIAKISFKYAGVAAAATAVGAAILL